MLCPGAVALFSEDPNNSTVSETCFSCCSFGRGDGKRIAAQSLGAYVEHQRCFGVLWSVFLLLCFLSDLNCFVFLDVCICVLVILVVM